MSDLEGADLTDDQQVALDGDFDMLRRVVRDLWTAAGLDPAPRRRRVEVEQSGEWIDLRVVRDAAPIPPLLLQALFDPFDTNDDDTGITIGLYLARALVVAHRGMLGVEQDDERGTFWIRLPATGRAVGPDPHRTHHRCHRRHPTRGEDDHDLQARLRRRDARLRGLLREQLARPAAAPRSPGTRRPRTASPRSTPDVLGAVESKIRVTA